MPTDDPIAVTERERPVRTAQPVAPQAELWHVLRDVAKARDADRAQVRQRVGESQERLSRLAADLADALHQLRGLAGNPSVHSGLDGLEVLGTIADKQEAALARAGVRLLDPVGEVFDDVKPFVEVVHAEAVAGLAEPVVSETVRPGVLLDNGELVRLAQVIIQVPEGGRQYR